MTSEKMIMTTTPTVAGKTVYKHLAVVSGSNTQNRGMSFELSINECLAEMWEPAKGLGADAIVSIQFSIEGSSVRTIGTAVKFK